jgi:hypothetical protein
MSAEMKRKSHYSSAGPTFFTPAISQMASPGDKAALQQLVSRDQTGVEQLSASISSHHIDADVSTVTHIQDTNQQFENNRNGVKIGLITASTVFILFIYYYLSPAHLCNIVKGGAEKRESPVSESVQQSQCNVPPLQPNANGENVELPTEIQAKFFAYSMQTV